MRFLIQAMLSVVVLCMGIMPQAFASSIVPTKGQSNIVKAPSASDVDVYTIATPNKAGISINKFDTFEVINNPLKLVNIPSQGETYNDAAMLVVIIAEDIVIQNSIELLGPASDILLLSKKDNGSISCSNCSFENFYRITFAAATTEYKFPTHAGLIGNLYTTPSGFVLLDNLEASGALAVEALADTVSLDGVISTHDRADSEGLSNINGYSQNQNGDFSIGTGSVNLMMGSVAWKYDVQKIIRIRPQDRQIILNGAIKSVEVKITSSKSLILNTAIDTRVDLLSTTQYKGQTYLPQESTTVQDFGPGITQLNNELTSEGLISIKSNGSINLIGSNTNIKGIETKFIATKDFFNDAKIESDNLDVAAKNIVNRGKILAYSNMEMWVRYDLINEFGGEIFANNILLQSKEGLIRNGSRTPFLSQSWSDSLFGGGLFYAIDPSLSSDNTNDLSNAWRATGGTYYNAGIYKSDVNKIRAPETHAYISSETLKIKSKAFENINPYWKQVSPSGEVALDPQISRQVKLLAEKQLLIDSNVYVLNSSAIIKVNRSDGSLEIKSGLLKNERYRVLNTLEKYQETNSAGVVVEGVRTKNVTMSPPAVMISLGDYYVETTRGFLNNISYLEVFGDAWIKGPYNDFGLEHQGKERRSHLTSGAVADADINQLDSLFYVHGNAYGIKSDLKIETDSIYSDLENIITKKALNDFRANNRLYPSVESVTAGDRVSINGQRTYQTCEIVEKRHYSRGQLVGVTNEYVCTNHTANISETYSILEKMKDLATTIINFIEQLYLDALSWWDE